MMEYRLVSESVVPEREMTLNRRVLVALHTYAYTCAMNRLTCTVQHTLHQPLLR